eukprot:RCo009045
MASLIAFADSLTRMTSVLTGVFIISGTLNTVTNKFLYTTVAQGAPDRPPHHFAKPWFLVWLMFLAMMLCLPVYLLSALLRRRYGSSATSYALQVNAAPADERTVFQGSSGYGEISTGAAGSSLEGASLWKQALLIAVPATCDCLATFLMSVGMLWISASIWQMSRGSIIIFTAIIRRVFRNLHTRSFQAFGILCVTAALAVVGVASLYIPPVGADEGSEPAP